MRNFFFKKILYRYMPKKEDIKDAFEIYHSYNLLELLNEYIDDCRMYALPILDKYEINKSDFIDLIKFNIDYKKFYDSTSS
tara:strand:- start:13 stop:255 length:243 start_codon:yes stop_codon:yes gene_type:complete